MSARTRIVIAGIVLAAAVGAYVEQRGHEGRRNLLTTAAEAASVPFKPAPIRPEWVLDGAPVTEIAEVAHTDDGTVGIYIWRTTAGTFRWIHEVDEIVTILDGAAFVTDADGRTRHLKPGDVALFPVGAVQTWRVPERVMKSAVLKARVPSAIEAALRWLRRGRGLIAPAGQTLG